jgi:hypothetical protein
MRLRCRWFGHNWYFFFTRFAVYNEEGKATDKASVGHFACSRCDEALPDQRVYPGQVVRVPHG